LEIVAEIVAAPGARSRAAAPGPEEIAEDVRENFLEALREVEAAEASALRALKSGVPIAIVLRAALRVGKDLVGLVQLLETFLGLFVAGIAVGMELYREAAIRLLEIVLAGASWDAEDVVVITFVAR